MSREILFRAKAINRKSDREYVTNYKNSDWVYGFITKLKDERYGSPAEMKNTDGVCRIEVDCDTIGQFTGQYDANKKKIYEGDIIQYDGDYDGIDGFTRSFSEKAIVLWDEDYCGFVCRVIGDESGDSYSWLEYRENPDLTIIGNIYDNSELLKA